MIIITAIISWDNALSCFCASLPGDDPLLAPKAPDPEPPAPESLAVEDDDDGAALVNSAAMSEVDKVDPVEAPDVVVESGDAPAFDFTVA